MYAPGLHLCAPGLHLCAPAALGKGLYLAQAGVCVRPLVIYIYIYMFVAMCCGELLEER